MATKNLIGNPYGVIEDEVNKDVPHSGFSDGVSASHLFTTNEGEIKIVYDELLEPNSEIRINNAFVLWQSPLVTRNLTNQKVRTHYIAQSIKNMWSDWRSYQFGGRYGDFATPELHFKSGSGINFEFTTGTTYEDNKFKMNVRTRYRTNYGSYGSFSSQNSGFDNATKEYIKRAFYNSFTTYFAKGSLGEHLGFQSDTLFTDKNTPNPWPFLAYLNFYKWFCSNKYVLRGNNVMKKVWFPDDEDDFKFKTGPLNKSTGVVGRFFSPEHRSGISILGMNLRLDISCTRNTAGKIVSVDEVYLVYTANYYDEANGYILDTPQTVTFDGSSDVSKKIQEYIQLKRVNILSNWTDINFSSFSAETWIWIFEQIKEAACQNIASFDDASVMVGVLDLFETRYMNFNKDYFTGGLISPLINSDYPTLGSGDGTISGLTASTVTSGGSVSSIIDFTNSIGSASVEEGDVSGFVNAKSNYIFTTNTDAERTPGNEDSSLLAALNKATISNVMTQPSVAVTINGTGTVTVGGFSISDLRLLSATTEYLEALARSDGDYRNMVLAIYGVKPTETSEAPIYIGGSSSFVQTEDIFQTTPTEDSPLGNVTQTGFSGGNNNIGSIFVKDTTVVLGLMSVVPEIYYYQGVPIKWTMRNKEQHQNPKFNGISMQAVQNRELFVSGNDSTDFDPFSYAPAWEFMRHRQNRLSGLCKPHFDPNTGELIDKPFTQMVQSRGFTSTPDFNDDFVSTKNNITTEHLVVQDTTMTPEFVVDVMNYVTEILPITKAGLPAKI